MAVLSGKNGKVRIGSSDLAEITGWTFNPTSNNPSYASSGTAGFKKREAGVKDGSGTISGKYDKADPIQDRMDVGAKVTLELHVDAAEHKFIVPAIIDSITYTTDMDDGEIVSFDADFSINGAFTNPI